MFLATVFAIQIFIAIVFATLMFLATGIRNPENYRHWIRYTDVSSYCIR